MAHLLQSLAWIAFASASAANPVFEELTTRGVPLHSGEGVLLPQPVMPDGLSASEQSRIVARIAGKYPLDRFVRNSVVAPFVLELDSVADRGGGRSGQRIDFYFVAHGPLEAMQREDLFRELVATQEGTPARPVTIRELTGEELAARKLTIQTSSDQVESYTAIDVPVLDRVQISGLGRAVKQKSADSVLGAWKLDERFVDDAEFPNRWQPILRDQVGRLSLGPPSPYAGLGGYIKVTRLHEPSGALFVECHVAFDEPPAWFNGRNLLRSKLPLIVQENVRKFRRKLASAPATP
jgi:hypothetical protein